MTGLLTSARALAMALPLVVAGGAAYAADIIETADEAGNFTVLLDLIDAAGMTETLKQDGPFTVFAPTDAAFGVLPEGQIEELLDMERRDWLRDILAYHVVPADLTAEQIKPAEDAPEGAMGVHAVMTLIDQRVMFRMDEEELMVNGATVVQSGVEADNGIIHVIDRVLLPTPPA